MKDNIEKFVALLIVLFLVAWTFSLTNKPVAMRLIEMFGADDLSEATWRVEASLIVHQFFMLAVKWGVAIWLWVVERRRGGRPWLWGFLALFGGLMAVVLYYLMLLHEYVAVNKGDTKESA